MSGLSGMEAIIGPREGDSNLKATASLAFGLLAMANVAAAGLIMAFKTQFLDGPVWGALPVAGFAFGIVALFLGSTGWIDVRRGVTDRRLRQAQLGTMLGGLATFLVIAALIVVLVVAVQTLAGAADALGDRGLDGSLD